MKIKALVLDMDGTITRFNLDFMPARRRVLEDLERLNMRTPEMTEQISLYLLIKLLKDKVDRDTYVEIRRKFYGYLQEIEIKAAQTAELYPGARETLRQLRGLGLKIGLVTNNGRVGTEMTIERLNLRDFFDAVVTRDDYLEMKPDPGSVRKVLEDIHMRPEDAILIGDGMMDIGAAKAAGLLSVAVFTGPFKGERLLETEPDYLLDSINDLPSLLEYLEQQV